jgi:hypothetical protein
MNQQFREIMPSEDVPDAEAVRMVVIPAGVDRLVGQIAWIWDRLYIRQFTV